MLQLLLVSGAVFAARVLPSAGELTYVSYYDGNPDIFLLDVQRLIRRNLTRNPAWDSQPSWSPDSKHMAFESMRDGVRTIYIMDFPGGTVRRLLPRDDMTAYSAVWSEDGRSILFHTYQRPNSAFYRVDLETGEMRSAADGPLKIYTQYNAQPRDIEVLYQDHAWGIFLHVPDAREPVRLTRDMTFIEPPQWSPNRRFIVFLSDLDQPRTEIFLIDVESHDLRQITNDNLLKTQIVWRP